MIKKILAAGLVLLTLLVITGCGGAQPTTVKPTPTAVAGGLRAAASEQVVAEGRVVPVKGAALSFPTAGVVTQVPVALGDRVPAGALLAQLDTRQLDLQVIQAAAQLAEAQAKLDLAKRGPTPEDLAAAQQDVTSAQAQYDDLLHPTPSDLAVLKADVDKAKAALDQAQAAYDRVGGDTNPQAGMLPQREQLQSAYIDYQKAQQLYNSKLNPTDAEVQKARAAIATAKSALAKLQPTADDVAAAQAAVNAAQAARDLAAEQVKDAKLVAPFAGAVTALDIHAGEYAAAGTVVVQLADTSNWQIETTDLTELNIVGVKVGAPVRMTFDAIPGLELTGRVTNSETFGENKQGDIVYTVVVTPDQQDARLRWNMTAKVNIKVAP